MTLRVAIAAISVLAAFAAPSALAQVPAPLGWALDYGMTVTLEGSDSSEVTFKRSSGNALSGLTYQKGAKVGKWRVVTSSLCLKDDRSQDFELCIRFPEQTLRMSFTAPLTWDSGEPAGMDTTIHLAPNNSIQAMVRRGFLINPSIPAEDVTLKRDPGLWRGTTTMGGVSDADWWVEAPDQICFAIRSYLCMFVDAGHTTPGREFDVMIGMGFNSPTEVTLAIK